MRGLSVSILAISGILRPGRANGVVVAGPVMTNERSSADQFRAISIFPVNPALGEAATD